MVNLVLDNPPGRDHRFNVGDDIQVVAAERLMPRVDGIVQKERISLYEGAPAKMILNGWFMHSPQYWPPPPAIDPLFVSIHINPAAADRMLDEAGQAYIRERQPVGARDMETLEILRSRGIDAYFSGCLTLTLDKSQFAPGNASRAGIVIADPLYKISPAAGLRATLSRAKRGRLFAGARFKKIEADFLSKVIPQRLRGQPTTRTYHSLTLPVMDYEARRAQAIRLLEVYANAELVITSRIHCALPCLAFGTPVIFVNCGLEKETESARLKGLLEFFHVISFDAKSGIVLWPDSLDGFRKDGRLTNKDLHVPYRDALRARCREFLEAPVQMRSGN